MAKTVIRSQSDFDGQHWRRGSVGAPAPRFRCGVGLDHCSSKLQRESECAVELLCEIAARISRFCRPQDVVARVGGDEFVVILSGLCHAVAYTVAQRLEQAMVQPMAVPGPGVVSITVGVSAGTDFGSIAEMVHTADQSMLASGWIS